MKSLLRKESWPILGILFLALALRIAGIGFGLPQLYHQDEPVIVNHAMAIGARGWNPHFFVLPPFSIYALFALYAVFFILGKLTGHFADASAFGSVFLNDPTAFYLIGRVVLGVFFGVLAVYWLYRVGTKHFSRKTGIY